MEKKIITISREFGSGGRTIGRMVAQELCIPFYDKELVDQIALSRKQPLLLCFRSPGCPRYHERSVDC